MAKMMMEATVWGCKRSKGDYEGVAFSSTRIFVEDTMGEDNENVRGTCTAAYKVGDADEFEKYKSLVYPFRARLDVETEADGKGGSRVVVKKVTPIDAPVQPAKKAA